MAETMAIDAWKNCPRKRKLKQYAEKNSQTKVFFPLESRRIELMKTPNNMQSLALLHKSPESWTSPFPGQTYPVTSVMGVPSAVKPFKTATRTWNSAT
mgnify:CR=1 FL=1